MTAMSDLKRGAAIFDTRALPQHLANAFVADKGFAASTFRTIMDKPYGAVLLGQLLGHFTLRVPYDAGSLALYQAIMAAITANPTSTYSGTSEENRDIFHTIAESGDSSGYRDRIGKGAARFFSLEGFTISHLLNIKRRTPILLLGSGAACVILARTLINAGFEQIRVLSERKEYGGIWNQKNVRDGSKNNPFPFVYEQFRVEAAPGSGGAITTFLSNLAHPPRVYGWKTLPPIEKVKILAVTPGDLSHQVCYRDEAGEVHTITAPIVVNMLGVGHPLPPSHPAVMTTDTPSNAAGIRWQHILTDEQAEKLRGKMLVFIGLGNSTAEMLIQIQRYRRAGFDIRYKVLTHYSADAIRYPTSDFFYHDQVYRLYRDPKQSQLTKLAGDLPEIAQALKQVRKSGDLDQEQLLSHITHWTIDSPGDGKKTIVVTTNDGETTSFPFDQLYTLIGYGHRVDELTALGMRIVDPYYGTIAYDYDGEVQQHPGTYGRARIYPGYFGLGALLKASWNPNAQVIPGILYQLPDLFTTLVLRACEHTLTSRKR